MYLMVLPGLAYLIINNYIPMFGIIIAFKKRQLAQGHSRQQMGGSVQL
jgi:ABC-type polysaccharide transport system, permease component